MSDELRWLLSTNEMQLLLAAALYVLGTGGVDLIRHLAKGRK